MLACGCRHIARQRRDRTERAGFCAHVAFGRRASHARAECPVDAGNRQRIAKLGEVTMFRHKRQQLHRRVR